MRSLLPQVFQRAGWRQAWWCALALGSLARGTGAEPVSGIDATTSWRADAAAVYEMGFARGVRRAPDGGVELFKHELIENDAAGAGRSEKGPSSVSIWGAVRARKLLMLADARTSRAELYLFPQRKLTAPLTVTINGHVTHVGAGPRPGNESVRWIAIPVEWLKAGENVIDLSCPEATSAADGWQLAIARADEFAAGGGDPAKVGATSFTSVDGGASWQNGGGAAVEVAAEYCVRLALERHVATGWLETPVIDLWKRDAADVIARQRMLKQLSISIAANAPPETSIVYSIRKGTHPDPASEEWSPYEEIGDGGGLEKAIEGVAFNRRYLQVRMTLATRNPLVTPTVHALTIAAEFRETFPVARHDNLRVVEWKSEPVRYPSIDWKWEANDRPELAKLRQQEALDEVVAGARTEYEAQLRLLDYAKKRWEWTPPRPDYPEWNAPAIASRINAAGGGGMCIQQNLYFVGLCQAFGWQGRLVCLDSHEVAEVWSNDYGKWIYFDAYFPNHCLCDPETGEPLDMLEVHQRYLEFMHPDRPIDWAKDARIDAETIRNRPDRPRVVSSSQAGDDHERYQYTGFIESRILRMVPRSDFIARPHPRPLGHAAGGYFWNGYVSWYDERTPIKGQYATYTDRARDLWPTLNTVNVTASQGPGNDRIFLEFETYTPHFSHFEVTRDGGEWQRAAERWTWLLSPGRNQVQVRAVNVAGRGGPPAQLVVNRILMPVGGWKAR